MTDATENGFPEEIELDGCGLDRLHFVADAAVRCMAHHFNEPGYRPYGDTSIATAAADSVDAAEGLWLELAKRYHQPDNEAEEGPTQ